MIRLFEQNCRECYACVRACPVKAIRVGGHPPSVIENRCILCGRCASVCSQGAIKVVSQLQRVKELLKTEKVVALLDPSFPTCFPPARLCAALRHIGFERVYEAALGTQCLIEEYKRLFKKRKCVISSICPVVKSIVCRHFPKLVKHLAPLPSTMNAAARMVEENADGEFSMIYISPCISYKGEILNGSIKTVLTLQELIHLLKESGVRMESVQEEEFDGPTPQLLSRLFPIREGFLKAMGLSSDPLQKEVVCVHGPNRIFSLFHDMEEGRIRPHFVDALFCEGCIDGPCTGEETLFVKKERLTSYVKDGVCTHKVKERWSPPSLRQRYSEEPAPLPSPSPSRIRRILESMQRYSSKDKLNCGACGYKSCEEKAAAIYQGLTDERVCLPLLLEQLGERRIRASWTLLERLDEAVLLFDRRRRLLLANEVAKKLFGIKDEMMGKECKLFPFSISCRKDCALRTGKTKSAEEIKIEGTVAPFIRSTHIVRQEAQVLGLLEVFREKTTTEEIERMKQDFVSNVSHELRTPLTSIKGALQLLAQEAEEVLTETQRTFLQIIRNNTERLIHLVNDLLDLSRLEAGMVELKMRRCDMIKIVNDSIFSIKTLVDEKKIQLKVVIKEAPCQVFADEERVKQVMVNLLSNAVKFNNPGGKVTITLEDMGKYICVCVQDTGVGIDEADLGKVFEKFYHAHLPSGFKAGARLGLAITKGIVQAHGGNIWVESKKGVGSKFYFTLPKREQVQKEGKKRILVVDDEEDVALLVKSHLEQEGYQVFCCHSGTEVVQMAKGILPHIIILDILMPDVDGFKIIEKIRSEPTLSPIPIIVLSIVHMEDEGFIFRLGIAEYLTKPLEPKVLLDSIKRVERVLLRKRKRILVVEDEEEQRQLIKKMIEGEGYTVLEAKDGEEALRIAQRMHPDLLVLDIMLPGMDGYAVIKRMKQHKKTSSVPIIVLTAMNMEQEKVKALSVGASKYIRKPFSKDVLIEGIKNLI